MTAMLGVKPFHYVTDRPTDSEHPMREVVTPRRARRQLAVLLAFTIYYVVDHAHQVESTDEKVAAAVQDAGCDVSRTVRSIAVTFLCSPVSQLCSNSQSFVAAARSIPFYAISMRYTQHCPEALSGFA